MHLTKAISKTSLSLLSLVVISSPVFSADANKKESMSLTSTLTHSAPLTVRSMGGYDILVPALKAGATVLDIQKEVAKAWNKKYSTNWTEVNVHLFGPGNFIVGGASKITGYKSGDVVNLDAIHQDKDRLVFVSIVRDPQ